MNRLGIGIATACALAALALGTGLAACGPDTVLLPPGPDGSASDGSLEDGGTDGSTGDAPTGDSSSNADGEASAPPPARLLLSYNGSTESQLVVFGLASHKVEGVVTYPGFIGTTSVTSSSPWLLEQQSDIVGRLDPAQPWAVRSTWNVALNDYQADAGFSAPYSDPQAVLVGAGSKAYVLRYTRNLVAVLDATQLTDGGAPLKTIDLSAQVQSGGDGYVEMTGGWFDPTTSRIYVLLANLDRYAVASDGYTQLCTPTHPAIVAIDTKTDALVPLAQDGGTGWLLQGYGSAQGQAPMVYDAAGSRLLVLETGCNTDLGDGGAGPLVRRGVEAVSLADGSTKTLLDLSAQSFPSGLYYLDAHHVIVQLFDASYMWDPASTTLGPAIAGAPAGFALDGQGNLVGAVQPALPDGGTGDWQVVSVNPLDGGATVLGGNPFPQGDAGVGLGFLGGAQLWPAR